MSEQKAARALPTAGIYPMGARVKVPNIAAAGRVIGYTSPLGIGGESLVLVAIDEARDQSLVGCVAVRSGHQLEASSCD
jgi:hypothetical protein